MEFRDRVLRAARRFFALSGNPIASVEALQAEERAWNELPVNVRDTKILLMDHVMRVALPELIPSPLSLKLERVLKLERDVQRLRTILAIRDDEITALEREQHWISADSPPRRRRPASPSSLGGECSDTVLGRFLLIKMAGHPRAHIKEYCCQECLVVYYETDAGGGSEAVWMYEEGGGLECCTHPPESWHPLPKTPRVPHGID